MSDHVSSANTPSSHSKARAKVLMPLFGIAVLGLSACATPNSTGVASSQCVGVASTVRDATVASYRPVTIKGDDRGIGAIVGATAGGLAGSQVGGRNSTQAIGAIGGAVLGGLAGNAIGDAATTSNGTAYILRFQNGETREIIQGGTEAIAPGTQVFVTFRCNGAVIPPATA